MQMQRSRDTAPDLAVRRFPRRARLRSRVDRPPLPGLRRRADIVLGSTRVAPYIEGYGWRGCSQDSNQTPADSSYCDAKLAGVRRRESETDRRLVDSGWQVVRDSEHALPGVGVTRIQQLVESRMELQHSGGYVTIRSGLEGIET